VPIPTSTVLTRPEPADPAGPLDDRFYDLVEERFRRLLSDNPVVATYLGVHTEDERLGDGSRDALLGELEAEKRHLAAIEALDPGGLSAAAAFERDLELHNVRRSIFDTEVLRIWERRSTALDGVGDAIFLLFARDHAPLAERLEAIGSRLEALPTYLDEHRTRARGPQVRLWQQLEMETARDLPSFFDEVIAAARTNLPAAGVRRIEQAATAGRTAIADYSAWLRASLAGGTDDWAIGRERYDALVDHRAFDGLDSDAILEIGRQQLAENLAARAQAASEIDPAVAELTVVDRIKSDHPLEFEEALEAYKVAMLRARQHLIDHAIVTVPDDERLEVVATPEYLRNVIPFAAYFEAPKFDVDPIGIYIVTPAVNDDPNAMREHNHSAISNTSIHEAYPGHHLQLSIAARHPSLTRILAGAPEFIEGWGMYCEQMMREQGFDDAPTFRLGMATDAIWRACRIILDIEMHRGQIGVDDATAFLVEQTRFEEANARAEVHRYTYTPTYPLSYLLGKVLLLELRADERRRLGDRFSLRAFHDALLRHGSLPVSFHRRLLATEASASMDGR
jgi:uncharacterized protein (DUF885 family)